MQLFNTIARPLAAQHGFGYLETFHVLTPVIDATKDSSHFGVGGFVRPVQVLAEAVAMKLLEHFQEV